MRSSRRSATSDAPLESRLVARQRELLSSSRKAGAMLGARASHLSPRLAEASVDSKHEWRSPALSVEVEPRSGEAVGVLLPPHTAEKLHAYLAARAHVGATSASAERAVASPRAPAHLDEVTCW